MNDTKRNELQQRNVITVTPYRRNQNKTNTIQEKNKLKKRSCIERKFSEVKHNNNRIHVRKDRNMINYMGFFYLGVIKTFK
jgi:hypothetical protein